MGVPLTDMLLDSVQLWCLNAVDVSCERRNVISPEQNALRPLRVAV